MTFAGSFSPDKTEVYPPCLLSHGDGQVDQQDPTSACILCGRGDAEVPIVRFVYRGAWRGVCSQHLPVLIHDPSALAEVLPGAEGLAPADHQD